MNKTIFLLATIAAVNTCNSSVPAQETRVKSSLQENIDEILATDHNKYAPDDLVKLLHRTWNCLLHEAPEDTPDNNISHVDQISLCHKAALIKALSRFPRNQIC